ncbi:MAG: hypothetical protein WBL68_16190 [Nitrososphaeraceae archaeon]
MVGIKKAPGRNSVRPGARLSMRWVLPVLFLLPPLAYVRDTHMKQALLIMEYDLVKQNERSIGIKNWYRKHESKSLFIVL